MQTNTIKDRPFLLSLLVHLGLLIFLGIGAYLEQPKLVMVAGGPKANLKAPIDHKPIIKAAMVDSSAVANAVARQQQAEKDRQQQMAQEKKQADKLKQEAKKAKEMADKLKAEAEVVRNQAKQELAKASKLQEQVAQAKKQVEQQAAQAKQLAVEQAQRKQAAEQAAAQQAATAAAAAAQQAQTAERQRWLDTEINRVTTGIHDKIYNNRTLSSTYQGLACNVQIQLMPDGSVSLVKVVSSSGNPAYDTMAQAAVYKSAPFEIPIDKELAAKVRDIIIEFKYDDYMS